MSVTDLQSLCDRVFGPAFEHFQFWASAAIVRASLADGYESTSTAESNKHRKHEADRVYRFLRHGSISASQKSILTSNVIRVRNDLLLDIRTVSMSQPGWLDARDFFNLLIANMTLCFNGSDYEHEILEWLIDISESQSGNLATHVHDLLISSVDTSVNLMQTLTTHCGQAWATSGTRHAHRMVHKA